MEFTVNGYLTDEMKESELVARVLTAARSFQTIDDEGRYMVVIDKKRDWPVMQINQENALELSNSRNFGKDVSGLKVTFTDANDEWQKNIIYAMGRYVTEFCLK